MPRRCFAKARRDNGPQMRTRPLFFSWLPSPGRRSIRIKDSSLSCFLTTFGLRSTPRATTPAPCALSLSLTTTAPTLADTQPIHCRSPSLLIAPTHYPPLAAHIDDRPSDLQTPLPLHTPTLHYTYHHVVLLDLEQRLLRPLRRGALVPARLLVVPVQPIPPRPAHHVRVARCATRDSQRPGLRLVRQPAQAPHRPQVDAHHHLCWPCATRSRCSGRDAVFREL